MARQRLNLTPEERKQYNRDKNKRSIQKYRAKAEREAYTEFVKLLMKKMEELGWSRTDLMLGEDSDIIESVVDGMIEDPRFNVVVSSKKLRYYKNMVIEGKK